MWLIIPAVAVEMLVVMVPQAGLTLRVALGRGEAGVFTADYEACSQNRNGSSCEWSGRFDGDDGTAQHPVFLEGDPHGWHSGTTARMIWLSDQPDAVFFPRDPRPVLLVLGLSAVAVAALVMWAVAVLCRVLGRPTPGWINRLNGSYASPPRTLEGRARNGDSSRR